MQKTLELASAQEALDLMGVLNGFAAKVDARFQVATQQADAGLMISGEAEKVAAAYLVWQTLLKLYRRDGSLDALEVENLLGMPQEALPFMDPKAANTIVCLTDKGNPVRAKTPGQQRYLDTISENELTFSIGPAGTGKTYLAVAMAVRYFKAREVSRLILTRPAVEAGESLGFLPGDLQSKVDPYMRPLYDALYDLIGADRFHMMLERGIIEISPLAYMRGRTLDNAFIILDEAQNTTSAQMKMFLTRIGFHSKAIVTGDVTQIDLPRDRRSGLLDVEEILSRVPSVGFVTLHKDDVVRNPLVKRIIAAYERREGGKRQKAFPRPQR